MEHRSRVRLIPKWGAAAAGSAPPASGGDGALPTTSDAVNPAVGHRPGDPGEGAGGSSAEEKDRRPIVEVVLVPDADHCVEALARREYRRCFEACLRSVSWESAPATRLDILRRFLEQADFRRLRRQTGPLVAAGYPVRFTVRLNGERAEWRVDGERPEEEQR